MIKRSSKKFIDKLLNDNTNWKILDIGCGYTAHKNANVVCDIQDLSDFYKDKKFIRLNGDILPFKDNEFDFVVASHVIEHVKDVVFFIKELERISSKGYIELPSRLGDNLVFENQTDHIWWFDYDDITNQLIASERNQLLKPFLTVSTAKALEVIFRESFVIQLSWENKINYNIDKKIRYEEFKPISFFKIFRKYLSKRIRSIIK